MRFTKKWVSLMRMCISTVSYLALVNNVSHGPIIPSRGLRQGDSLSPSRFLICAKGLVSLLKKAENDGCLRVFSCVRIALVSIISSLLMVAYYFVDIHSRIIFRFSLYCCSMRKPLVNKLIEIKLQYALVKIQ